jgi:phosphate transport system substrate-binding protein
MQRFRRSALMLLATGSVALAAACGSGSAKTVTVTNGGGGSSSSSSSKVLTGAGSTLVYPLVSQWEPDYSTSAGVTITYGAIGSGGGIDQITARAVDFGASDAPLTPDQATACKGCLQIPWALGATTVAYNVSGVPDHLHLTGSVLADIFLGNITTWNDAKIKALNPGVNLPSTKITPIYRSDGSGDSFVFSSYLSAVSPTFKSKIGASTQPPFSVGTAAAKNSGVAASIQSTNGAIGYVALSYIAPDALHAALIQNAAGQYPVPGVPSIKAAAKAVTTVNPDGSITLVNPPASATGAYPLSTYTYAIVPKTSPKASTLKAFLMYAISPTGQAFGPPLGFPELPAAIVASDTQEIAQIS